MKIIILRDWEGNQKKVEIGDDVEFIAGVIISGDMVMAYPFFCDASDTRTHDYLDGSFKISREKFDEMNRMKTVEEIMNLDEDL